MRKKLRYMIILIPILFMTGCWDSEDINHRSITIAVGVDRVNGQVEFTGEIVKLASTSQDKEGTANPSGTYTLQAYGDNYEMARVKYDANAPYKIFLGATRVVLFGEAFAKDGIESYLNRIDSLYDFRKTLLPAITQGTTASFIETGTDKDLSIGFLVDNILTFYKESSKAICPNIGDLLSIIAFGHEGYLIPYLGIKNEEIAYLGLCVFKDSQLINIIPIEETKPLLYLLTLNPNLVELVTDPLVPNNKYSYKVTLKKRKVTTRFDEVNNNVVIDIKLNLKTELRYQYQIMKLTDEMIDRHQKIITEKTKKSIEVIIAKAQREYETDIFGFGQRFRAEHYKRFTQLDWEDAFIAATINVTIESENEDLNLRSYDR